jgi:hypothetical protein
MAVVASISLTSCAEDHEGVSFSLQSALKDTVITCEFLKHNKFSNGYWVRSELDGWGLLVISSNNKLNYYDVSLQAHGHERALETRKVECEKL